MKKTYINPTIEVIMFNPDQPMLNGSIPLSETDTDTQFSRDELFDIE
jgi:hypothetical protein